MAPLSESGSDTNLAGFPTYAELTQTRVWGAGQTAVSPAPAPPAAAAAVAGVVEGRYSQGTLLGAGGMGKVILARDARIGREVAVKQLHEDRELSDEERARFLREARVQGQLEHPSIVPVYDLDQLPSGATFFTMRRVLGRTLQEILAELRTAAVPARYSQRELLTAFATVCLTIDYAHSRGVIHRDLKPANLMLGDFGEVYVLDWGLARLVDEAEPVAAEAPAARISRPGMMMGTPLYMAPEQYADPTVGPEADVFSLGVILFEILTLLPARDPTALFAPIDARMAVRAPLRDVAPELEAICIRATETAPVDRFPSARALHAAVTRYLDGDRELEQRRTLAAGHATAAVAALAQADEPGADYEAARGAAMRDLVRALSLDPTNREHVATLAAILQTLPRAVPAEVERAIDASEQAVVREGARASVIGPLVWFLFLPLVYALGIVHDARMIPLILVPAGAAAALGILVLRMRRIGQVAQLAVAGLSILAIVAVSRLYGPLVLGPTLVASFAIPLQVHPVRAMRRALLALGCLALIAPVVLEAAGVLPPSYAYEHGRMLLLPQVVELTPTGTIAVLLSASVLSLIAPALFVSPVRVALSAAERRLLLQAWHFRRLGDR